MKYSTVFILLTVFILGFGCKAKDPSGIFNQIEGALQYGNHAQAFAYAARHGEKTTISLAENMIRDIGKPKACKAMATAIDMLFKEYTNYYNSGKISEATYIKEAHTRMLRVEFDLCR